jgi:hypothetical protein
MNTQSKINLPVFTAALFSLALLLSLTLTPAQASVKSKSCSKVKVEYNQIKNKAVNANYDLVLANRELRLAKAKARANTNNYLRIKSRFEDQLKMVIAIKKSFLPIKKSELQKETRKLKRLKKSFQVAYAISLQTGKYHDLVEARKNILRKTVNTYEKKMRIIARYGKLKGCNI